MPVCSVRNASPRSRAAFWVRAYWPDKAILDGTWKLPVIAVLQERQSVRMCSLEVSRIWR